MRILIIGGTRFIGPHVVNRLVTVGHEVTVFNRGKTECNLPVGVDRITGDRNHLAEFRDAFRKNRPDVVLDMIPVTQQDAQIVVDSFGGIAKRIVAISSQDVYYAYGVLIGIEDNIIQRIPLKENAALRKRLFPYRGETPRPDDDPQKKLDDYDKILVENVYMRNPDLSGTVLRLPMVYGPRDGQHRLYEYLKRMDDNRPAIILELESAKWRWSRAYVENIADAIVLALLNDKAKNRIYNIAEQEALSTAEWIKAIARVVGWKGKVVIAQQDELPPDMHPTFNTRQHLVVDSTRIREELGFKEEISQNISIERTVEWERCNPPANIDTRQFDYKTEDDVLKKLGIKH
jgi:nucleoside-diphosphate-sugar epimerase